VFRLRNDDVTAMTS